ncbi:MAG: exosortase-associated EpsI family protein [Akkermansiaceae bacterium]
MKKRAIILLVLVVSFVGMVLALPKTSQMRPSRLAKDLPEEFGHWVGRPQEAGTREREVLSLDTEFERMNYAHRDEVSPSVQVSIVFSGKDLSQSIHRPEVCLRAQGWQFVSERYFEWNGLLPGDEAFPVKEIVCRTVATMEGDDGKPVPQFLENGEPLYHWRVFYYTFLGHEKIMAGHYQRTGEDIKDRLFKGYDQRWAYVTISCPISKKYEEQGVPTGQLKILDEEGTEKHVEGFLKELLPLVVADPGKGEDPSLSKGGFLNYE